MLVAVTTFFAGLIVGAVAGATGNSDGDEDVRAASRERTTTTTTEATATTEAAEEDVEDEGSGSPVEEQPRTNSRNQENPPQADMGPVECTRDSLGDLKATGMVTNHSSERSNYMVTVAFESPDGAQQLDTGTGYVSDLEPGQSAAIEVITFTDAPAEFTCRVTEVERYASF